MGLVIGVLGDFGGDSAVSGTIRARIEMGTDSFPFVVRLAIPLPRSTSKSHSCGRSLKIASDVPIYLESEIPPVFLAQNYDLQAT